MIILNLVPPLRRMIITVLVSIYAAEPKKYDFMPLIRTFVGSSVRESINWEQFAETLTQGRNARELLRTGIWICRPSTRVITDRIIKMMESSPSLCYDLSMPPPIDLYTTGALSGTWGRIKDTCLGFEAFNATTILEWAVKSHVDIRRMIVYGLVLHWTKEVGKNAVLGRAQVLAKRSGLKQEELLMADMQYARMLEWPNVDLYWGESDGYVNAKRVETWNNWVKANFE